MPNREKVIKGLERHSNNDCEYGERSVCPYWGEHCSRHLCSDALAMLKQYEESWKRIKYSVLDAQMSVPANDEKTYEAYKCVVEWMDREEKRWEYA